MACRLGYYPLILAVLSKNDNRGTTIIPIKDCQYKGEHPNFYGLSRRSWGSGTLDRKELIGGRGGGGWLVVEPSYETLAQPCLEVQTTHNISPPSLYL